MSLNIKCPKCGGIHVQLSNERSKHGCIFAILFGIYYVIWVMIKWLIGLIVLLLYDWWVAIIHSCCGKGHIWRFKKWFSTTKKIYYCHDCGYNFRV